MDMQNIREQFNAAAQDYDKNRKKFIHCFNGFYESTTNFLATTIKSPKKVLDLGGGTGLLTSFWLKNFPNADYVISDIAEEMLNIAKKRFGDAENISYQITDYTKKLPEGNFDTIVSGLSIHHLEDDEKQKLFNEIYEKLPKGGIFVNYDQFKASSPIVEEWFLKYWQSGLENSGLTLVDLNLWSERRKLDKECSVEDEKMMLKQSGFNNVDCIYTSQKFSVIAAIK